MQFNQKMTYRQVVRLAVYLLTFSMVVSAEPSILSDPTASGLNATSGLQSNIAVGDMRISKPVSSATSATTQTVNAKGQDLKTAPFLTRTSVSASLLHTASTHTAVSANEVVEDASKKSQTLGSDASMKKVYSPLSQAASKTLPNVNGATPDLPSTLAAAVPPLSPQTSDKPASIEPNTNLSQSQSKDITQPNDRVHGTQATARPETTLVAAPTEQAKPSSAPEFRSSVTKGDSTQVKPSSTAASLSTPDFAPTQVNAASPILPSIEARPTDLKPAASSASPTNASTHEPSLLGTASAEVPNRSLKQAKSVSNDKQSGESAVSTRGSSPQSSASVADNTITTPSTSSDPKQQLIRLKDRANIELQAKDNPEASVSRISSPASSNTESGTTPTTSSSPSRSSRKARKQEKERRKRERDERNERRSRGSRRRRKDKAAVKAVEQKTSSSAVDTPSEAAPSNSPSTTPNAATQSPPPPPQPLSPIIAPTLPTGPVNPPVAAAKPASKSRTRSKRKARTLAPLGADGAKTPAAKPQLSLNPDNSSFTFTTAIGGVRIICYSFLVLLLTLFGLPRVINKLRRLMAPASNSHTYSRFGSSALAASTAALPPPPPSLLFNSGAVFIASLVAHCAYLLPPSLSASLLRTVLPYFLQTNTPVYRMLLATGSVFGTAAEAAAVAFHASNAYGGSAWSRENLKRGNVTAKGTINSGAYGPFGNVDVDIDMMDDASEYESGGMTDAEDPKGGRRGVEGFELSAITRKGPSLGPTGSPTSAGTTLGMSGVTGALGTSVTTPTSASSPIPVPANLGVPHRIPVIHGLVAEAAAYTSKQAHGAPVALSPAAAAIVAASPPSNPSDLALIPPPPEDASSKTASDKDASQTDDTLVTSPSSLLAPAGVPLLTRAQLASVVGKLPPVYAASDLRLLYSLDVDGASLATFYQRVADWSPLLLVVKDSRGYLMGAFCSDTWRPRSSYFGGKRTFVFTLYPKFKAYFSTEKNIFYQLATRSFIAVGGGDNHALWLDENFKSGSSGPSQTFGSPRLSGEASFRITNLQAFGFIPPQQ